MIRLALTPGCPAGIGPEVLARAIVEAELKRDVALVWCASQAQLLEAARRARVKARAFGSGVLFRPQLAVTCVVDDAADRGARSKAGVVDDDALASQRDALVLACRLAARGGVDGIVTGPVRKKALVVDGVAYPGQTEIVASLLGDGEPPLMVFAGGPFVLGLATVHMALADVPAAITPVLLERCLRRLDGAARKILGGRVSGKASSRGRKTAPRIAVLGVNPHAGEGGMFGREEIDVVTPALANARAAGLDVTGPIPADGFFADVARSRGSKRKVPFDAVLAMSHDQGLAPYKLLVGGEGINVTWGTRVPRTSPDHGTADAIAGKGVASAASMTAALELCARLAR